MMNPLDTTPATCVLFFDMQEFDVLHQVRRDVVEATKHPLNPILPLGNVHEWDCVKAAPWEGRTVIYDEEEGLFKAWYSGVAIDLSGEYSLGYATSCDGVRWHKPKLGLIEFNGSTDNNLCFRGWGPVVKDVADEDPRRRYKMIAKGSNRPWTRDGIRLITSPDGIHWEKKNETRFTIPEWGGKIPDVINFWCDDQEPDANKRFKYVWQTKDLIDKPFPQHGRVKHLAFSPDARHWTAYADNPFFHPVGSPEQENHFLMIMPYRGWWIALYEFGWYLPEYAPEEGMDLLYTVGYLSDVRLAVSRDGVNYTRIESFQKVIPRGGIGQWDGGYIVISDKPAIKDDTIYLYYAGNPEDSGGWSRRPLVRPARMGLATLQRDRFTCLNTCDGESFGHAITQPIVVRDAAAAHLIVNLSDTKVQRSWLEVDVLDAATGEPIPGYDRPDAVPLVDDGLDVPVTWKENTTLGGVDCEKIQLRFRLYGAAKLYSFRFDHGHPAA